eukprot:TRINITY_DN97130_c0_g1_i1.p1 TRINITY_DN97130_c0_g1~~TRINITY_DN97130_c0_g1_i1.p1  ORF type:complete len:232 (-),score=33.27 TRINITY_DN97130_c0_g1_i1:132-788(-)
MVGLGFMGLVCKACPRALLGAMLGLKTSLDGMAGTAAPAVGGLLYYIGKLCPYAATALVTATVALLYTLLPPEVGGEEATGTEVVEPLLCSFKEADDQPQQVPLGRLPRRPSASLGMNLYAGKTFSSQCLLNQISLTMDPELKRLYDRTLRKIGKVRGAGRGGLRTTATVGQLCASDTDRIFAHDRELRHARNFASDDRLWSLYRQSSQSSQGSEELR